MGRIFGSPMVAITQSPSTDYRLIYDWNNIPSCWRSTEDHLIEVAANPNSIHHYLTDPNYRGDEHYPVGVETNDPDLGPDWKLDPDDMELRSKN